VEQIRQNGQLLLSRKHFCVFEIREVLNGLITKVDNFEQDLDAEIFEKDAASLETWIQEQVNILKPVVPGDSNSDTSFRV